MTTNWTPKNLSIVGGMVLSALLILPNLDKAWAVVRYITDAFPTAYAAKQQVEAVDQQFEQYLQAQKEAAIAQKASADAINAYVGQQQQMQQQVPVRMPLKEWQDEQGVWWCCDPNRDDCDENRSWWRCE